MSILQTPSRYQTRPAAAGRGGLSAYQASGDPYGAG